MPSATSAGNLSARTGPTPRPALAIDRVDEAEHELLARPGARPVSAPTHELDAALADRRDELEDRAGGRRPIAGHEHDDVGHARQRAEVRLRAQARGAVAAARLAQHERTGIARDFGAAIRRRAIDDDDRADRAMRQIAQQRARLAAWSRTGTTTSMSGAEARGYGTRGAMALTYKDAGVDIDAGNALVERIKPLAKATTRPEVLGGIGGFAALCRIPTGVQGADPGQRDRRRRNQAQDRVRGEPPRHDRHRPRRDVRQRRARHRRRAAVLPRLLRAPARSTSRPAASVIARHRRGLQAGRLRARRRRDRGAARPLSRQGLRPRRASASASSRRAQIRPRRDLVAGDVVIGLPSAGLHSNGHSLARKVVLETLDAAARCAARRSSAARRSPTRCCARRSSTPMRSARSQRRAVEGGRAHHRRRPRRESAADLRRRLARRRARSDDVGRAGDHRS